MLLATTVTVLAALFDIVNPLKDETASPGGAPRKERL
jgi:hypothetical protein